MISGIFNRKFHATLGDILESKKKIVFFQKDTKIGIDISKLDINGLKILLKILDHHYPKTDIKPFIKKTSLKEETLMKLYGLFGFPKSIKDITAKELSDHLKWIQAICSDNSIYLHDQKWDALLKKAEEYGNQEEL